MQRWVHLLYLYVTLTSDRSQIKGYKSSHKFLKIDDIGVTLIWISDVLHFVERYVSQAQQVNIRGLKLIILVLTAFERIWELQLPLPFSVFFINTFTATPYAKILKISNAKIDLICRNFRNLPKLRSKKNFFVVEIRILAPEEKSFELFLGIYQNFVLKKLFCCWD